MNLRDITLVLGVDAGHLEELRWAWASWLQFKPEILQMPLLVFYDAEQMTPDQATFLMRHPAIRWVPWAWTGGRNQREKMITGFVHISATEVTTPWYLKLDTDTMATREGPWLEPAWFNPDSHGRLPVFIASKWPYTKPRYAMDLLDDWGDSIPPLSEHPRLNLPYSSESNVIRHQRIISWFFIGNTEWTRAVYRWLGPEKRLPLPSQDTFLFYCAARQRQHYIRKRIGHYGWAHVRFRKLKHMAQQLGISPTATMA
jgi:hypothetical protein